MAYKSGDPKVMKVLRWLLGERLALKPGEEVLIVADMSTELEKMNALASAVASLGGICNIIIGPDTGWKKNDPYALTRTVAKAHEGADLVIAATDSSSASLYSHELNEFRKIRRERKIKWMWMEQRPYTQIALWDVDWRKAFSQCTKLEHIIQQGKEVRITAKNGTDISAKIGDYTKEVEPHERWLEPGMGGVIDCEVHFTPNFGTTEGVFLSDGPGLWVPGGATHPLEPIKVTVEKGKIVKVEGGKEADIVRGLVETSDKGGRNDVISELGVGMNPYWTPDCSPHWEKKGLGNMHIAFGGRETRTAFHCDLSIYHGTFWVDGKKYVDDGKLLF